MTTLKELLEHEPIKFGLHDDGKWFESTDVSLDHDDNKHVVVHLYYAQRLKDALERANKLLEAIISTGYNIDCKNCDPDVGFTCTDCGLYDWAKEILGEQKGEG